MTVALIGAHGVGKTTIGRLLAAELDWPFDEEIGRQLRDEALAADPEAHAMASGEDFDREVFARERARDRPGPRVVETWHPGNFAYTARRSPHLAAQWENQLRDNSRHGVVVPLFASRATLAARQTERGPPELVAFFEAVGREAEAIARRWDCRVCAPVCTDGPIAEVLRRVADAIR